MRRRRLVNLKTRPLQSLIDSRPDTSHRSSYRVTRTARFGRAPRVVAAKPSPRRAARVRSDVEKEFESNFTRMAHQQRFRSVREKLLELGEVTERVCRNYATYSDSHGTQFAVVKPLSDGGLRVGVGDFDGIAEHELAPAVGLGGSSRIQHQTTIESYEVVSGRQLGLLRRAYEAAQIEHEATA